MRRVLLSVLLLQDGASAFTQPPIAHNRAKPPVAARSHGASAFTHPRPLIAHYAKALGAARSPGPTASAPQQQATTAAAVLGLCSQPIMWWSLYTLNTTGCGLPAGPFGLLGAAGRLFQFDRETWDSEKRELVTLKESYENKRKTLNQVAPDMF